MSKLCVIRNMVCLTGEVSFKTVANLNQDLAKLIKKSPDVINTWDCGGVTKTESSIVALLIVAIKQAAKADTIITIVQPPETLVKLLKFYELQTQFILSKRLK
jgi:phospholipid transport system transporter-binding protein